MQLIPISLRFELEWHDDEGAGWTDLLPAELFQDEAENVDLVHKVRGKGELLKAYSHLTVTATAATFDYSAPEVVALNEAQGVTAGILGLLFVDSSRTAIK